MYIIYTYSSMYISIYIPSLLNLPPTPIAPLEVITES